MAFYPQFPAFYAYPMPYPSQDFYAMYPPGSEGHGPAQGNGPVYFDGVPPSTKTYGHGPLAGKPGYNNRKDSADSGISDFSNFSSRKSSSTSTASSHHMIEESPLDDVKEEEPYEDPDDELCEKIVAQVEFYFGDANITKDKFLLKHVKRNKEGFVSLKLISSFKRVKHLTKDWRQVAEAIERKSSKLEVNDLKTKVRRLDPLPEYDETTPSRTVVALNLPLERPTIEAVAEIFSVCGDIVLVRILRPGNPIPADIKPFANKHPEMIAKVCALVEFEKTEFALKAVRELNSEVAEDASEKEKEEKMIVMELTAPSPKSTKSKEDKRKVTPSVPMRQPMYQQMPVPMGPTRRFSHAGFGQQQAQLQQQHGIQFHQQPGDSGPRRRISLQHNMKFSSISEEQEGTSGSKGKELGLNPNAPTFTMHHQRKSSRPSYMGHVHPEGLIMAQAAHAAATQAAAASMGYAMAPHLPMMRRISAYGGPEIAASGLSLPPNVIRLPRGPEKNAKGFQRWCKARMQQQTEPQPMKKPGSRAVPIVAPPSEEENKDLHSVGKDEVDETTSSSNKSEPQPGPSVSSPAPVAAAEDLANPAGENLHDDSGNEDEGHFSEPELEPVPMPSAPRLAPEMADDNERTR